MNDTPYTHVAQNVDVPTLDPFDAALPRLQAYIQQRGNHYVPKAYWRDRKLGRFVHVLRAKGPDALTPEQQAQLDSIGFTFDFDQVYLGQSLHVLFFMRLVMMMRRRRRRRRKMDQND